MDYDLLLGDRLAVVVGENRCISGIQEITPQGTLIISIPMIKTTPVILHKGDNIQVLYYRENGTFTFFASILRVFKDYGMMLMEIRIASKITRNQSREFVRFETVLPVTLVSKRPAAAENEEGDPVQKVYRAFTKDISGGGMQIVSQVDLQKGSVFICELDLNGSVSVETEVVRSSRVIIRDMTQYAICLVFINNKESVERKFVKYIFKHQAEQRKKFLDAE